MADHQVLSKIADVLGLSFGNAADPVQPSQEQREKLWRAEQVRALLSEGIKETPAEISARETQFAKNALAVTCERNETDKVTGRAMTTVCKPFESPKAF